MNDIFLWARGSVSVNCLPVFLQTLNNPEKFRSVHNYGTAIASSLIKKSHSNENYKIKEFYCKCMSTKQCALKYNFSV